VFGGRNKRIETAMELFGPPASESECEAFFSRLPQHFEVVRLPGERVYKSLTVADVKLRKSGVAWKDCQRQLLPTTHRLFIGRPGGQEQIPYDEIERLRSRIFGTQGVIRFRAFGVDYHFSTKRLAAPAFQSFVESLIANAKT
jgi:hypothetical protein